MLKTLKFPFAEKFELLLGAQRRAVSVGYAESDIRDIIKSLRRKKNRGNCGRYKCFNLGYVFWWILQKKS